MEYNYYQKVVAIHNGIKYEYNGEEDSTKWVDAGTQYKALVDIPKKDIAISAMHEFSNNTVVEIVNVTEVLDKDGYIYATNESRHLNTILHI